MRQPFFIPSSSIVETFYEIDMIKRFVNIFLVLLTLALSFSSCKRNREALSDTDTSLAQKYSSIEQSNSDLDGLANEIVFTNSTSLKTGDNTSTLSLCANVILNFKNNDSLNATVDFGNVNCLCGDQKYRKGIVNIVYGKLSKTISLSTQNYYVNNNKVEVSRTLKFILPTYFVINSSSSITFTDSNQTVTESSQRTINWTEGSSTQSDKSDDVFVVSGNGSGTNYNGDSYTVNITTPLTKAGDCSYLKSGIIEIIPDKKLPRKIDFGNGNCDNLATISIGKFSKIISLK